MVFYAFERCSADLKKIKFNTEFETCKSYPKSFKSCPSVFTMLSIYARFQKNPVLRMYRT